MPLGPQIVTYGNVQSTFVLTVTLTFVATAAASTVEQNVTINGLQLLDQVSDISLQAAFTSALSIVNARVSAANTLTLAISNYTAGSLTYPTGSYYIEINRPMASTVMTAIQ